MRRLPFLEPCTGCDGFCEVVTESDYLVLSADEATIGDIVYCTRCWCFGVIDVDERGQFCHWCEELCESCMRSFERRMERLAGRLAARIDQGYSSGSILVSLLKGYWYL